MRDSRRIIAYCRVSTNNPKRLEDQERRLRDHLGRHAVDLTNLVVLRDLGPRTAHNLPDASKLVTLLNTEDVGIVAVVALSRLPSNALRPLAEFARKGGVVLSCDDPAFKLALTGRI